MTWLIATELLRSPKEIARRCREDDGLRELTLVSIGALVLGTAVYGGVLGAFRGDVQVLFSAIKVPLVFLATLVLVVPAFYGIAAAFGRPWPMRTIVSLTLSASARGALVLLAFAPVLWLASDLGIGYHTLVLGAVATFGLAALAALGILLRGIGTERGFFFTSLALVAVFVAVLAQTAWSARPFFGRPSQEEIPFVRDREGTFIEAIAIGARSTGGYYCYDVDPTKTRDGASRVCRWD
jgi:hypothetical protein